MLSSLVGHYTATDIDALIPLIRKNLTLNHCNQPVQQRSRNRKRPNALPVQAIPLIVAEPLDWVVLHETSSHLRRNNFSFTPVDLLLIVDCIYHPSLLPALLSTIDYLTVPEQTAVLVVVELRAEDVIRQFLEGWLTLSQSKNSWEIWSIKGELEGPYAVWVGWKKTQT